MLFSAVSSQTAPCIAQHRNWFRAAPVVRCSQQQQQPGTWMPPGAWISSVLGQLQLSVDVDSVEPYTRLLQECVVLQPGLLTMPPADAAALCWQLERYTRCSSVWFGPATISALLQQHTPTSLSQQLSSLLDHWLSLGQSPHTFGQLWLLAPGAMLRFKDVTQFESHLAQLGQAVPELPPSELLVRGATLAGFLLSLNDVSKQLEGHVHRAVPGVIVFSHSSLQGVRVMCDVPIDDQLQEGGPVTISVWGVVRCEPSNSSSSSSGSSSGHVAEGGSTQPPWRQQQQHFNSTGGVYEQQHTSHSSSSSSSEAGSSPQQQQQQQQHHQQQEQLLTRLEVWPAPYGLAPVPILVPPPR